MCPRKYAKSVWDFELDLHLGIFTVGVVEISNFVLQTLPCRQDMWNRRSPKCDTWKIVDRGLHRVSDCLQSV